MRCIHLHPSVSLPESFAPSVATLRRALQSCLSPAALLPERFFGWFAPSARSCDLLSHGDIGGLHYTQAMLFDNCAGAIRGKPGRTLFERLLPICGQPETIGLSAQPHCRCAHQSGFMTWRLGSAIISDLPSHPGYEQDHQDRSAENIRGRHDRTRGYGRCHGNRLAVA